MEKAQEQDNTTEQEGTILTGATVVGFFSWLGVVLAVL